MGINFWPQIEWCGRSAPTFQIENKLSAVIHRRQRPTCVNIFSNFMETYVLQLFFFIQNVAMVMIDEILFGSTSLRKVLRSASLRWHRFGRIRIERSGKKVVSKIYHILYLRESDSERASICSRLIKVQSKERKECDYAIFGHRLRIPVLVVPFLQNCLETKKFKYLLIKWWTGKTIWTYSICHQPSNCSPPATKCSNGVEFRRRSVRFCLNC